MRIGLLIGLCLVVLGGCAMLDRNAVSLVEPLKKQGGYDYYRFVATECSFCIPSTERAPEVREKWFRNWFHERGYVRYEIVSRDVVLRGVGPLGGEIHDIYYVVRATRE